MEGKTENLEKPVIRSIAPPGGPPKIRSVAPPGGPPKPVMCQAYSSPLPCKDLQKKVKDLLVHSFGSGKLQEILGKKASSAASQNQDAEDKTQLEPSFQSEAVAKTLAKAAPTQEEVAAIAA